MSSYERLERLTRKWWLYALLFVAPAILPPFAATGLGYWGELNDFIWYVSDAMYFRKLTYWPYMPVLHLAAFMIFVLLAALGNRFGGLFALFAALNFAYNAFMQTGVATQKYGLVIVTELLAWYLIVILLWLWESRIRRTEFTLRPNGRRLGWLIPLAVFAYWDPDQAWVLDPAYFVISFSPTSFCMMTPIYLTTLLFAYPRVNLPLLRVHSFIGVVVGVITLVIAFMKEPSDGLYWTLLHAPLILISTYGFILGMKRHPLPQAFGVSAETNAQRGALPGATAR